MDETKMDETKINETNINLQNILLLKNILLSKEPYTLISLGPNCFTKEFIKFLGIDQETHFFDYIGSTLWSLCDLIQNDFKDLFKYSDYKNMHVLKNSHIISNQRYYLNFKHDFPQNHSGGSMYINTALFIQFQQKYKRRILRFQQLLQSKRKILFIRTDVNSNRVQHTIHETKYNEGNEIYYFQKFIQILKEKYPSSNCTFLFLTKHIDENQRIEIDGSQLLLVKASKQIEVYKTCKIDIFNELWNNRTFLQTYV
jgi:hypothetical protein